jgi:hypothetical protein
MMRKDSPGNGSSMPRSGKGVDEAGIDGFQPILSFGLSMDSRAKSCRSLDFAGSFHGQYYGQSGGGISVMLVVIAM